MNLTFLLGIVGGFALLALGIAEGENGFKFDQLMNFWSLSSLLIVLGGTLAATVAGNPVKRLLQFPKHIAIVFNQKKFNPAAVIDDIVEFAQIARKNGLLALEEKANQLTEPFFKKGIMLIVDGNDADKVRNILESDIEELVSRHDNVISMYERASSAAPAFGMVGTLIGLINMLQGMSLDAGESSSIGQDMGVALITTMYGVVLANLIFNPIACNLRVRDEEEYLCRQLIVEGITAIQSGENPKFIRERLMGFLEQGSAGEEGGKKSKGKKKEK